MPNKLWHVHRIRQRYPCRLWKRHDFRLVHDKLVAGNVYKHRRQHQLRRPRLERAHDLGNCYENDGAFVGGHNTIYANAGNDVIYGDCAINVAGVLLGGHNTIYAGTGNATMYGSASAGNNTFVFGSGTGLGTIMDFDQHGGVPFSHGQGDVIDVSAYHLAGFQSLSIVQNAIGDAVITLPLAGASHAGQITLVGVHASQLTASDFHF
jgi:Ca2+-binding RTX toxin-like protein